MIDQATCCSLSGKSRHGRGSQRSFSNRAVDLPYVMTSGCVLLCCMSLFREGCCEGAPVEVMQTAPSRTPDRWGMQRPRSSVRGKHAERRGALVHAASCGLFCIGVRSRGLWTRYLMNFSDILLTCRFLFGQLQSLRVTDVLSSTYPTYE